MRNYIEVKMCMTFRKKIIEFSFDTAILPFRSLGLVRFFFKDISTFIQ